eukprot:TRINITY_DN16632_c0_g1_i1.p1 TRINITY_DN16632_c0_g1~~TRINITY_DN16632_c0_g1_i1.p1  ORF type:complete len:1209 (-),score=188.43 TRINITY_DN16632_c0_g1_i1:6-3602(-)
MNVLENQTILSPETEPVCAAAAASDYFLVALATGRIEGYCNSRKPVLLFTVQAADAVVLDIAVLGRSVAFLTVEKTKTGIQLCRLYQLAQATPPITVGESPPQQLEQPPASKGLRFVFEEIPVNGGNVEAIAACTHTQRFAVATLQAVTVFGVGEGPTGKPILLREICITNTILQMAFGCSFVVCSGLYDVFVMRIPDDSLDSAHHSNEGPESRSSVFRGTSPVTESPDYFLLSFTINSETGHRDSGAQGESAAPAPRRLDPRVVPADVLLHRKDRLLEVAGPLRNVEFVVRGPGTNPTVDLLFQRNFPASEIIRGVHVVPLANPTQVNHSNGHANGNEESHAPGSVCFVVATTRRAYIYEGKAPRLLCTIVFNNDCIASDCSSSFIFVLTNAGLEIWPLRVNGAVALDGQQPLLAHHQFFMGLKALRVAPHYVVLISKLGRDERVNIAAVFNDSTSGSGASTSRQPRVFSSIRAVAAQARGSAVPLLTGDKHSASGTGSSYNVHVVALTHPVRLYHDVLAEIAERRSQLQIEPDEERALLVELYQILHSSVNATGVALRYAQASHSFLGCSAAPSARDPVLIEETRLLTEVFLPALNTRLAKLALLEPPPVAEVPSWLTTGPAADTLSVLSDTATDAINDAPPAHATGAGLCWRYFYDSDLPFAESFALLEKYDSHQCLRFLEAALEREASNSCNQRRTAEWPPPVCDSVATFISKHAPHRVHIVLLHRCMQNVTISLALQLLQRLAQGEPDKLPSTPWAENPAQVTRHWSPTAPKAAFVQGWLYLRNGDIAQAVSTWQAMDAQLLVECCADDFTHHHPTWFAAAPAAPVWDEALRAPSPSVAVILAIYFPLVLVEVLWRRSTAVPLASALALLAVTPLLPSLIVSQYICAALHANPTDMSLLLSAVTHFTTTLLPALGPNDEALAPVPVDGAVVSLPIPVIGGLLQQLRDLPHCRSLQASLAGFRQPWLAGFTQCLVPAANPSTAFALRACLHQLSTAGGASAPQLTRSHALINLQGLLCRYGRVLNADQVLSSISVVGLPAATADCLTVICHANAGRFVEVFDLFLEHNQPGLAVALTEQFVVDAPTVWSHLLDAILFRICDGTPQEKEKPGNSKAALVRAYRGLLWHLSGTLPAEQFLRLLPTSDRCPKGQVVSAAFLLPFVERSFAVQRGQALHAHLLDDCGRALRHSVNAQK